MRKINATINAGTTKMGFYITNTINNLTVSVTAATRFHHNDLKNSNLLTGHSRVWCFTNAAGYIQNNLPSFNSLLEMFCFIETKAILS